MVPSSLRMLRAERTLEATWADTGPVRFGARLLRCECRCAGCVDEITGRRILDVRAVLDDTDIRDLGLVGGYAIKFTFSDGHDTGLYAWEHLRELVPQARAAMTESTR